MKKFLLIFALLILVLFCACEAEKPIVDDAGGIPLDGPEYEAGKEESSPAEKVVVTVDGKDYEVFVPEKTRFEVYEGAQMYVYTPSLSEGAMVDLSGLSGCEYLEALSVVLSGKNENLILPKLPNLGFCEIFGNDIAFIDASAIEGCGSLQLPDSSPDEIEIGKGPESVFFACEFDLSKLAGAENIKDITVCGNSDLSKIADIGEVEKVYILGENESVSGLENLKSLKKLSLQSFGGDLSGIEKLSMESLAFNSDIKQETFDTVTKSETVTMLSLNDEFITNSDFLDMFPNLEELYLTVDPIQPAEVPVRDEITDKSQIEALATNVSKEKLAEFFEKGIKIYIMDDWSRT